MVYDKFTYQALAVHTSAIMRVVHAKDLKIRKLEKIRTFLMDLEAILSSEEVDKFKEEENDYLDALKKLSEQFASKTVNELTDFDQ